MTRRASLPGADELFRANTTSLTAVRQMNSETVASATAPTQITSAPVSSDSAKPKKGVRSVPRRRVTSLDKSPSGRERHDEKITVYLSADELFDLDQARLMVRGDLGLSVDRGRIVRESIAVIIADLESKGENSILARRLRGL